MDQTKSTSQVDDGDIVPVVAEEESEYVIYLASSKVEESKPFAEATFDEDSQGSAFVPPLSSQPTSDPPSDDLDSLHLVVEKILDKDEVKASRIDRMRALCQSVHSDKTSRRSEHEDGSLLSREILSRLDTEAHEWCRLCTLADTGKGYAQVSYAGANKFATVQELLIWCKGDSKAAFVGKSGPEDVSHLCDNRRCTLPDHVVVETKEANNRRKGCRGWVPCSKRCQDCRGSKNLFICEHIPRCIRYHSDYDTLEEFFENGVCEDRNPGTPDRGDVKRVKTS